MANFNKHQKTGANIGWLFGLSLNFYYQSKRINSGEQKKIDILQLLGFTAGGAFLGAVGGVLPDILEPATNPHHRNFFHSLTVVVAASYGLYKTNRSDFSTDVKAALTATGIGYLSHLALDSSTPKSLPLI